ncbi:hypothetical protein [Bradyrhizobium diazoefficiens]|uniref:hypothetical protein n=1 Tax=Bradyrhizobium diazoefficiens TaxID=1355477 RepID=UPI001B740C6B|nr:hypothetical protein [Bradyrhizobium japonicum]
MPKRVLTIGVPLADQRAVQEEFKSKISLLDWDIILFRPTINDFIYGYRESYRGRPCLSDDASFSLKEACEHWRREIKQAFDSGKTVIIFLPQRTEVYVDSGNRQYSGTGRNQRTTRLVDDYDNYATLPIKLDPINATGSEMKLTKGGEVLGAYWAEFGPRSKYEVLLAASTPGVCLTTKSGDKPVGAIVRSAKTSGALVLLPDMNFLPDDFFAEENSEDDEVDTDDDADDTDDDVDDDDWSSDAKAFASRFVHAVIGLDTALRASAEVTPEPAWAIDPVYALATERVLRSELLEAERQVEEAQSRKEQVQDRLGDAAKFRVLLYEKGKPLERAIIDALKLLGFNAAPFKEGSSEFDVVFSSDEGRLIGEAEGKDTKAINIDKLRQLTMNIQEDLRREEVSAPAKGVLFGNGYRLSSPPERDVQFTEKCISSSRAMNTALVATTDLYRSVQYVSDTGDVGYAKQCREALLSGVGLVSLPVPPLSETNPVQTTTAESAEGEDRAAAAQ